MQEVITIDKFLFFHYNHSALEHESQSEELIHMVINALLVLLVLVLLGLAVQRLLNRPTRLRPYRLVRIARPGIGEGIPTVVVHVWKASPALLLGGDETRLGFWLQEDLEGLPEGPTYAYRLERKAHNGWEPTGQAWKAHVEGDENVIEPHDDSLLD